MEHGGALGGKRGGLRCRYRLSMRKASRAPDSAAPAQATSGEHKSLWNHCFLKQACPSGVSTRTGIVLEQRQAAPDRKILSDGILL